MSSRVNAPLAPMQCQAGRSPLPLTGSTLAEVWRPPCAIRPVSTPLAAAGRRRHAPIGSSPTAAMLDTSAPSLLSTTAVPPAVPAGDIRMVSTSAPLDPSGMVSTVATWMSSTWTPMQTTFMAISCGHGVSGSGRVRAVVPRDRRATTSSCCLRSSTAGFAHGERVAIDGAQPLEQQRVLDRLVEGRPDRDRAVVGHQRRRALERGAHAGGELGRAEGRVRRHPDRAAEQQLLVVDDRDLAETRDAAVLTGAWVCTTARDVGVGVDGEVQVDLGRRHQAAADLPPSRSTRRHLLLA